MVVVNKIDAPFALAIRKKLGKATEYGQKIYAQIRYGEEEVIFGFNVYGQRTYGDFKYPGVKPFYGVYQKRAGINGTITVKEKFYIPLNKQTVPQQANRSKFADAIAAWQALTDSQKEEYNKRVAHKNFSGYNLFISEYLFSN